MTANNFTVDAIYENGVFRPKQALPLQRKQRVRLIVQFDRPSVWPKNTAKIYEAISEEERRLAASMFQTVQETWPKS